MITLKEIAQKAGVSAMTVSNVINGKYSKVSPETVKKITELVKEYHYTPNLSARSLCKKESKIIAVFVYEFHVGDNVFVDPYFSELFGEVESLIRGNGYYTIIQSLTDSSKAVEVLNNWNADGAVFLSHQTPEDIKFYKENCHCPLVFIDSCDKEDNSTLTVGINDFKGGYIATKYLIEQGHKKIGFCGYFEKTNSIMMDRYSGYLAALKEYNLQEKDSLVIDTITNYDSGLELGKRIANKEFDVTALFATTDLLALGIIEGLRNNGVVVPKDLSVIGFDNLDLSSMVNPKLTTISQDIRNKAKCAVTMLLKSIKNEKIETPQIICDVQLEIRQSVCVR